MNEVKLVIRLDEPVTDEYLAQRVAEACAKYGALRRNEGVFTEAGVGFEVISPVPRDVGPFTMHQYVQQAEHETLPTGEECAVCHGQLPPYDFRRHLAFCQMSNHWHGDSNFAMRLRWMQRWKDQRR